MSDSGAGSDRITVVRRWEPGMAESGRERGTILVRKWDGDQTAWASRRLGGQPPGRPGFIQPTAADFARLGVDPYDVSEAVGNLITQAGWGRILDRAVGGTAQGWDATHARIGVGTATAAATTGQTDLSAATGTANRLWVLGTGVGTTGTGTGTARLTIVGNTVGSGDGNFVWAEWATDQGTASGSGASTTPLLNRAVSALGTKASPATWTPTVQLDFT
jgi:hypothetical protein